MHWIKSSSEPESACRWVVKLNCSVGVVHEVMVVVMRVVMMKMVVMMVKRMVMVMMVMMMAMMVVMMMIIIMISPELSLLPTLRRWLEGFF